MYSHVKPLISIPVHGEYRHLKRHSEVANEIGIKHPMLIANGDIVQLSPGIPNIIDQSQKTLRQHMQILHIITIQTKLFAYRQIKKHYE